MRLSTAPDLAPTKRLLLASLGVTLVVALVLATHLNVRARLGDTDDAMRLVMVRGLGAGGGWYDQWIARLDPPAGLYMHLSRLIDGGLAGLIMLLRTVTSAPNA